MIKPRSSSRGHSAPRGRPRSLKTQEAVFDAARALVEEGGYPAATIEAIAARSGVAKTTIYRRWPSRGALFVDLMAQITERDLPPLSGSDPLRALHNELCTAAGNADRVPGRVLTSLLWEAQHDPEVRKALLERVLLPRRESRLRAIRQAQEMGALRRDLPPNVAVDLLWGPLFYRMWVRHEPIDSTFVTQVFKNAMAGMGPHGRAVSPSGPRAGASKPATARSRVAPRRRAADR
jgi:AcrR family transcriptional regulator